MTSVLLNGLWQGIVIVAAGAIATAIVPQRHAATRYAVWFAALAALAVLPLLTLWRAAPELSVIPAAMQTTAATPAYVTSHVAAASGSWPVLLWIAGFAVCIARLALSWARIERIVRCSRRAAEFGADVLVSEEIALPIAAGLLSPVVVLPATLIASLGANDVERIVQHERAHIRRHDVAGNFIQRVVEAGLFFNPWVYVIARQLVKEREAACDDWAVLVTGEPDRYASCLAQLARGAAKSSIPLLTPSAIGSRRMLVGRIARILNGKVSNVKTNYAVVGVAVAVFTVLGFALQPSNSLASVGDAVTAGAPALSPNCYSDAKVKTAAQPDIPESAFQAHHSMSASSLVTVGTDGRATNAKIVSSSGNAAVDRATIDAAMRSTYSPELKNCKRVVGPYLFHVEVGP